MGHITYVVKIMSLLLAIAILSTGIYACMYIMWFDSQSLLVSTIPA